MNRYVVVVVYVVCGLDYDLAFSPFPFPIDPDVLQLPVLLQPCAIGTYLVLFVWFEYLQFLQIPSLSCWEHSVSLDDLQVKI